MPPRGERLAGSDPTRTGEKAGGLGPNLQVKDLPPLYLHLSSVIQHYLILPMLYI